jgi:hypothetical protein
MGVACGPRYPLIRLQALGTACTEALEVGRYTLLSLTRVSAAYSVRPLQVRTVADGKHKPDACGKPES